MKQKCMYLFVFVGFLFIVGAMNVKADTIKYKFTISSGSMSWEVPNRSDYKYAIVEFPATENARTIMSFYGSKQYGSNTVRLGQSANFYLKKQNKVYILPRSGMACPADATYCMGAGLVFSGTTILTSDYQMYALGFDGGDSSYSGTITYFT